MPKENKLIRFNDILKNLINKNYTDIKFTNFGFLYTHNALEKAIISITSKKNYLNTFKKQLSNYGFFAQNHNGDKKYMYRAYPHENGFPYKPLPSNERRKIVQTYKTTPKKIFKKIEIDDDMSVIDES